jgi:hypothetical protein
MLTPERPILTPERSSERIQKMNYLFRRSLLQMCGVQNYSRLKVPWDISAQMWAHLGIDVSYIAVHKCGPTWELMFLISLLCTDVGPLMN